jgi:hypothetical protein
MGVSPGMSASQSRDVLGAVVVVAEPAASSEASSNTAWLARQRIQLRG